MIMKSTRQPEKSFLSIMTRNPTRLPRPRAKQGTPPVHNSQTSYISADQAKAAAFAHANVNEKDVSKLKVDFDQDHGKAEYEVKFDVANMEYEYEIDAVTGEVISYEMDHD